MQDNPLISVVIPVYNVEEYLSECVDSVINQTYKNLDIILVDDGSPDNCPAICDDYAGKDSRVRVIHRKNGGPGVSRNCGIKAAQGEFIAFVDSDDYVSSVYIEQLYTTLRESGSDISYCTLSVDREKLSTEIISNYDIFSPVEAIIEAAELRKLERGPCCKLYRRSLHEEDGGIYFPENIFSGEDWVVTAKLFSCADSIALSGNILYFYRLQNTSLMHTLFNTKYVDFYTAWSIVTDHVSKKFPNEWPKLSKHFRNDYISNTVKLMRDICLSENRNDIPYDDIMSNLAGRIKLRDAIGFMFSSAGLPKKLAALLTAVMPKLAVKIIERSGKYVPAYK